VRYVITHRAGQNIQAIWDATYCMTAEGSDEIRTSPHVCELQSKEKKTHIHKERKKKKEREITFEQKRYNYLWMLIN
jgi:hypothetical protein